MKRKQKADTAAITAFRKYLHYLLNYYHFNWKSMDMTAVELGADPPLGVWASTLKNWIKPHGSFPRKDAFEAFMSAANLPGKESSTLREYYIQAKRSTLDIDFPKETILLHHKASGGHQKHIVLSVSSFQRIIVKSVILILIITMYFAFLKFFKESLNYQSSTIDGIIRHNADWCSALPLSFFQHDNTYYMYVSGLAQIEDFYTQDYFIWFNDEYIRNDVYVDGFDVDRQQWRLALEVEWVNEHPNWNVPELWKVSFHCRGMNIP
jgi:hypothetical protein